jgi:hypothetical protein
MKLKNNLEVILIALGFTICLIKILAPMIERDGLWITLWHIFYPEMVVAIIIFVIFCTPIYFYFRNEEKKEQQTEDH